MSSLSTVRFVAQQQHFKLLDTEPGTSESHWAACVCLLVTPITKAGRRDLTLESSVRPVVSASGFPPVALHFDVWV